MSAVRSIVWNDQKRFPFDERTEQLYASCWWHKRTGIGQLAQALFLKEYTPVLMLAFYGDGSGEVGRGPMVVAGYLGHTRDLFDLEHRWCSELQAQPPIEYFRASECVPEIPRLSGQFKGWSPEAAATKRLRLAKLVYEASPQLVAISSTVQWDEYRSVIGDGPVKSVLYHPYFLCFHGVLWLAFEYANRVFAEFQGRVAVVLDTESNKNVDVDAAQQFRLSQNHLPEEIVRRMGSITWDTDIQFPLLQVADLLAWSVRAAAAGLPSPVLDIIRSNRLAACACRDPNPASIAQWVIDRDARAASVVQS
jgi:hypothetical protein